MNDPGVLFVTPAPSPPPRRGALQYHCTSPTYHFPPPPRVGRTHSADTVSSNSDTPTPHAARTPSVTGAPSRSSDGRDRSDTSDHPASPERTSAGRSGGMAKKPTRNSGWL